MTASIAALEELYRRRYPAFLRVALAALGDLEPARDAVQEAFSRAIRSRFEFRGDGSLDAWVWRTLTNVCLSERRAARPPAGGAEAGAEANGSAQEWPELRAAVAAL